MKALSSTQKGEAEVEALAFCNYILSQESVWAGKDIFISFWGEAEEFNRLFIKVQGVKEGLHNKEK